jgi:hypothetical protein
MNMNAQQRCWCFDVLYGHGKKHSCCQCEKCVQAKRILHFDFNNARLKAPNYCFSSFTHSEIFEIHLKLFMDRERRDR